MLFFHSRDDGSQITRLSWYVCRSLLLLKKRNSFASGIIESITVLRYFSAYSIDPRYRRSILACLIPKCSQCGHLLGKHSPRQRNTTRFIAEIDAMCGGFHLSVGFFSLPVPTSLLWLFPLNYKVHNNSRYMWVVRRVIRSEVCW